MLLACDGTRMEPLGSVTGSKGDPVATIARPSDQMYACTQKGDGFKVPCS